MRNNNRSRMFPFITCTWNPVKGCLHDCIYCWARELATGKLRNTEKYKDGFKPAMSYKELYRNFKPGEFVFVSDMGDLFGAWVPRYWITTVLSHIAAQEQAKFLLLTKNPARYLQFEREIPLNCVCGVTIETNRSTSRFSKAPSPKERFAAMLNLDIHPKFVAVEPIMDFDPGVMLGWLKALEPEMVAIGYDNYQNNLPEPPLSKTMQFIQQLRGFTKIISKTLRRGRVWSGKAVCRESFGET